MLAGHSGVAAPGRGGPDHHTRAGLLELPAFGLLDLMMMAAQRNVSAFTYLALELAKRHISAGSFQGPARATKDGSYVSEAGIMSHGGSLLLGLYFFHGAEYQERRGRPACQGADRRDG